MSMSLADPRPSGMLFKVLAQSAWEAAEGLGRFEGVGIDVSDGFIHLSAADQVVQTVRVHFAGQSGLVLVAVDPSVLGQTLRWEASRGGDLFPHVYGVIPMDAVIETWPLPIGQDGGHVFPESLGL